MTISRVQFSRKKRGSLWKKLFLLFVLLLLVGGGAGWYGLLQTLPRLDGDARLSGLERMVTVKRDAYGIPHIQAESRKDAWMALGYVHAQDRFLQMELMRRAGAGRLSELVGSQTLDTDRAMRSLELYYRTQLEAEKVSPELGEALDAYAAGVNAWLKAPDTVLPAELEVLMIQPDPWSRADSLVWGKLMGLALGGNWRDEEKQARIRAGLDPDLAESWLRIRRPNEYVTLPGAGSDWENGVPPAPAVPQVPEAIPDDASQAPLDGPAPVNGDKAVNAPDQRDARLENPGQTGAEAGAGTREAMSETDAVAAVTDMLASLLPAVAGQGLRDQLGDLHRQGAGSNAWVLSGAHTESGSPLLANDPHLGYSAPILWYLVRIDAPDMTLAGATVPGVPMMVIGHNGHIGWGYTMPYIDIQDLVLEKRAEATGGPGYLTPEGPKAFDVREEIIRVRLSDDERILLRRSRHGPVVSDHIEYAGELLSLLARQEGEDARAEDYALVFSTPQLQQPDTTPEALFAINQARSLRSFREALNLWVGPSQNVFYADQAGNIGHTTTGLIPVRDGYDGLTPARGWTRDQLWTGFIPREGAPHVFNPENGRIVNGNNRIVGPDYPWFLAESWPPDYRARRIDDLLQKALDEKSTLTLADMQAIQLDHVSGFAVEVLPLLLAAGVPDPAVTGPEIARKLGEDAELVRMTRQAHGMLSRWDGSMAAGRPEPLLFMSWVRSLAVPLFQDEFGEELSEKVRSWQPDFLIGALGEDQKWCDDIGTDPVESCDLAVQEALVRTVEELRDDFGSDLTALNWGEAHEVRFSHMILGRIPLLGKWTAIRMPTSGSNHTVNRGGVGWMSRERSWQNRHGAGLRVVLDLADLNRSGFMIATGESGNLMSERYDDLAPLWRGGALLPLVREPAVTGNVLRLQPGSN